MLNRVPSSALNLSSRGYGSVSVPRLGAYFAPGLYAHPAPPKEFNPDGSPKKYRLNQFTHDHGYTWERWQLQPAGLFHTVYEGVFAQDMPRYWATYGAYPPYIAIPVASILLTTAVMIVVFGGTIGIKPKRFTVEWIEANKERDRVENTNAVTNYLDRRRRERGPHWLLKDYVMPHPYVLWMGYNHHDTELLRERED